MMLALFSDLDHYIHASLPCDNLLNQYYRKEFYIFICGIRIQIVRQIHHISQKVVRCHKEGEATQGISISAVY